MSEFRTAPNTSSRINDNGELRILARTNKITKLVETPTFVVYGELQSAYEYFKPLFPDELPECVLTLYHHSNRTLGYYRADGFRKAEDGSFTDEIALNPKMFDCDDLPYVLSVLVHEMAHLSRHRFGLPKRKKISGYHDKIWGDVMEEVGLIPSNTGLPGGNKTGFQMMHYIEEGGPFELACNKFIESGFGLTWSHIQRVHVGGNGSFKKQAENKSKRKFQCDVCKSAVWGKPSTFVICGKDRVVMKEVMQ